MTVTYKGQQWQVIGEQWRGNMKLLTLQNTSGTVFEWEYVIQYGLKEGK